MRGTWSADLSRTHDLIQSVAEHSLVLVDRVKRRVLFPTEPGIAFSANTTYCRRDGTDMLQILSQEVASDTGGKFYKRTSKDNGRTWSTPSILFEPEVTKEGILRWGENAFLLDDSNDALFLFYNYHIYPQSTFTGDVERFTRIFYVISRGECGRFPPACQLIQKGHDTLRWADGVTYGTNNAAISFCRPIKTSRGETILPIQSCPVDSDFKNPFLIKWQAGCFIGDWDGDEIEWGLSEMVKIDPKLSSRGLCEPAIAELGSGAMMMVCRGSNSTIPAVPGYKWYCVSKDAGHSWSSVSPFSYDDGSNFFSPATGSMVVRNSRNRKLYWFGNIVPQNPDGNRPRYPLQVAEVNEKDIALRKDSVMVIEGRREEDSQLVQFSNFKVYEDRETGEFVLTMARFQERGEELTSPAYEYRIEVL